MTSAQKSENGDQAAPLIFRVSLFEPGRTRVETPDGERTAEEVQWATGSRVAQVEKQCPHFSTAWAFPVPTNK